MPKFLDIPQWYDDTGSFVSGVGCLPEAVLTATFSSGIYNSGSNTIAWGNQNYLFILVPSNLPSSSSQQNIVHWARANTIDDDWAMFTDSDFSGQATAYRITLPA